MSADDFDSFLSSIRGGAVSRETDRRLLFDEVAELKHLGFAAARVPVASGGDGLTLEQLFARLIALSAADSSLGHVWRGHILFVEALLASPDAAYREHWFTRLSAGDLVGNAQSERHATAHLETVLDRDGELLTVTGTKYYTTGSIYADWIYLSALDGTDRVAVTVSAHDPGTRSVDDWDGFGQPLTGSGTTTFDRVPVDPRDLVVHSGDAAGWHRTGALQQLILLGVVAGIAQRALEDTVDYVRSRRRTVGHAGEHLPREDPLVQSIVGQLSSVVHTARALVLASARTLDEPTSDPDASRSALLEVFRVQQVVLPLVLDALSRLFEVGGASAVGRSTALDRHWRNVRTIASHNPAVQRSAALGQFELNGTLPEWQAPGARHETEPVPADGEQA
ncbi:hypothetical protein PlfCFBP13513_18320 [Plantibacter flavus]|uniref:acyl-CoA dehydrogenase family protein n=1 Tax=Plantibacter flavus TaxID=150123 RepID=UPI0010C164A7|nr:acyl-CoA dehydrogenase family protein [Plantibacter flavus]TKJ95757.1 hypothetical protein PlfCFBP13513_18320 [Plantibacter flavus]